MMRYWKSYLLLCLLLCWALVSPAQLMSKIQDIFTEDIFFVRLKEVHAMVQGEEGKAVPLFLEKTMKNPKSIPLADFRREKEKYYALCKDYNSIIEEIVVSIQGIDKLKDFREVNLLAFKSRIDGIGPKFETFFKGLSNYHNEAAIVGILLDIYKLGKPIIQHLIQEKVETIKHILIEQLRSLKITPLPWEATEAVVESGQIPSSQEEIRAKVGLASADHYRSLNLSPGSQSADVDAAHAKLIREYEEEISSTSNPEIKEFFQQLSNRVTAAKRYFDANPPHALSAVVEKGKLNPGTASEDCEKLKGQIIGVLGTSKYMTKEELVEELRKVVGND